MRAEAKGAKVLIVDDDPVSIALLQGLLAGKYDCSNACNGRIALDLVSKTQPDIVLLDVNMPDMDGYEVCRTLKASPVLSDIPVIFLTSQSETRDIVEGFNAGAVDYVKKPFSAVELYLRMETQLQLQAAKRDLAHKNNELREQQNLFLEMIPHDMRTCLTIISGNCELLQRIISKNVKDDEPYSRLTEDILDGCDRLKSLLADLLDVGRIKAGSYPVVRSPAMLRPLVGDLLSSSGKLLDVDRYRVEISEDFPVVAIDRQGVVRILINLMCSAEKYAKPASTILIRASYRDSEIMTAVIAEEDPFDQQDLEKIFVPYYRSFHSNTTEGVGLGLHVAKLLVEAYGGRIWVERVAETQNSYCFTVPIESSPV